MESARLSLIIFSIIFLLSMFGIGKEMGDSFNGMVVMALAASSPHFLNLSRAFYTDLPQIAFTALSLYLLIKSDSYSHRLYSILTGVALALSFLSKWSTAFFMLFPILWFFIPVIIKKAKSNTNRLISLGAGISIMGSIFLYYYLIDTNAAGNKWILCYLLAVLIPSILWGLLIYFQEKILREDKEYRLSGNYALMNFSLMTLTFLTLTSPWYLWSGHSIKQKFMQDMVWQRNIPLNLENLLSFIKTAYNFAPILLVVGLVYIFIKREKLFRNLVFPLSFLTTFCLMAVIGNPQFRYVFTLLIFLAVTGGFWVSNTGKAKFPITFALVTLSFLSIFAWTVIPPEELFYKTIRINCERQSPWLTYKLFCSEKPDNASYNSQPVIDWVFNENGPDRKPIIFIVYFHNEEIPIEMEYLYWVAYRKDKDLGPIFFWNMKERNDKSLHISVRNDSYSQVFRSQTFEDILIMHRTSLSKEKIENILKTVIQVLGSMPDNPVENIDIGSNVTFTCLRYKKGLKRIELPKTKTPTVTPELNN